MIPAAFEYLAPKTLEEAVALLQEHGEEAKILSGGHSLIPIMKLRLATPKCLIDINQLSGLDSIEESDGYLKIGALVREVELEESELIRSKYSIIYETTRMIADPQVRNLATVGGNLAHGDPANDHPATMLALRAEIVATGPDGQRVIPIEEFFVDFMATALRQDEILVEIRIPIPEPGSGGAYFKLERKVGDYAVVGAAAQLTLDDEGRCRTVGLGLTNVGLTPIRAKKAEESLRGRAPDEEAIAEAARLAAEEADPSADLRGSVQYKRAMVKELTKRALRRAAERAS